MESLTPSSCLFSIPVVLTTSTLILYKVKTVRHQIIVVVPNRGSSHDQYRLFDTKVNKVWHQVIVVIFHPCCSHDKYPYLTQSEHSPYQVIVIINHRGSSHDQYSLIDTKVNKVWHRVIDVVLRPGCSHDQYSVSSEQRLAPSHRGSSPSWLFS